MKLKEIAQLVGGELSGGDSVEINGINGIKEAREGELTFILNSKFEDLIDVTKASAVIVPKSLNRTTDKPLVKVDNPSIAFSRIIDRLFPNRIPHPRGIHQTALVAKTARIGKDVAMGPYVVVEEGSAIGDGTILYPFCYVGKNTKIGSGCIFYPNVSIRDEISIGNRVIIHSGSVVGSDGFGYDTGPDGVHVKIPQMGTVVIEDDVEIGACATVDRARFNKTVIGKGTKIDNLVQIAHNVIIGPYCLIAAQSGISGSSEIGRNVVFGGQVGMADHIKVGDFTMVAAKSGISKSYPAKSIILGYPARPIKEARASYAYIAFLPKLFDRVKALESRIKELEEKK